VTAMNPSRLPLALVGLALLTSSCRRDRAGVAVPASAEPVTVAAVDGGPPASTKAEPPAKTPFSAFRVADGLTFSPAKLANGALVGIAFGSEYSYAAVVEPNGDVVPIRTFAREPPGDLIRIEGTWPGELFADFMFEGQWRTRGYQRFAWAVTEKGIRDVSRSDARFSVSLWSGGRVVALTAPWLSALTPELSAATFKVAIVSGGGKPGAALPKLPVKTLNTSSPGDALVAYPTGRVFVTGWDGLVKTEPGMVARTGRPKVWVLDGATWATREPPVDKEEALALVRGADETQTLLVGRAEDGSPYLARWDGKDFVRVEHAPSLSVVSIGTDGVVWAIEVSGDEKRPERALRRATFPELRFEPVALPKVPSCPALAVTSVVARSSSEVWVDATCGKGDRAVVFHTSSRTTPLTLPTRAELLAP
jgi:hypothetical protein